MDDRAEQFKRHQARQHLLLTITLTALVVAFVVMGLIWPREPSRADRDTVWLVLFATMMWIGYVRSTRGRWRDDFGSEGRRILLCAAIVYTTAAVAYGAAAFAGANTQWMWWLITAAFALVAGSGWVQLACHDRRG